MLETFFGEKGQGIENLFISSFRLLRGSEIKDLIVSRLLFTFFCHLLTLFAFSSLLYHYHTGLGWLGILSLLFFFYPYSFLYHINKRACQTWIAYGKITNHPATLEEAKKITIAQKWPLRLFAVVELALARAENSESDGGIFQFIVAAALAALSGLYDIAESYLLPAIMIEKLHVSEAAEKLRQLKQNVPTTLAGVFGLDIFGGVISALMSVVSLAIFLLAALAAYSLSPHMPPELLTTFNIKKGAPLHLFLFPIILALILVSLIHSMIKILVTSLKATYFAVFYTAINRPNELSPEAKEKVISYLKLQ